MKTWIIRIGTLLGLLALGWALHAFLAPLGLAWVVWTLGGVAGGFLLLELALRWRKRSGERADWARWKGALLDPSARRRSIRELTRALERARRLGARTRVTQTRLAIALAELHLADGRSEAAVKTLARIDVSKLEPLQAVIVRVARVQAYLHGGDVDGAASTLTPLEGADAGDPVLDASLALARGAVALEEDRPDEALEAARAIVEAAEPHDELWDEAKGLEAACLAARGDDPAPTLDALEAPGRARLAAIGSRRLRELL